MVVALHLKYCCSEHATEMIPLKKSYKHIFLKWIKKLKVSNILTVRFVTEDNLNVCILDGVPKFLNGLIIVDTALLSPFLVGVLLIDRARPSLSLVLLLKGEIKFIKKGTKLFFLYISSKQVKQGIIRIRGSSIGKFTSTILKEAHTR